MMIRRPTYSASDETIHAAVRELHESVFAAAHPGEDILGHWAHHISSVTVRANDEFVEVAKSAWPMSRDSAAFAIAVEILAGKNGPQTKIVAQGNTYAHRDALKSAGFRWDGFARRWELALDAATTAPEIVSRATELFNKIAA